MKNLNKLFWHIKCLVRCLRWDCEKYDIGLIVSSLEKRNVSPDIADSPLGKNIKYILENLADGDIKTLLKSLKDVSPRKAVLAKALREQDEVGNYVKAVKGAKSVPPESYGIIFKKTDKLFGLFLDSSTDTLFIKEVVLSDVNFIPGKNIANGDKNVC